MLLAKQGVNVNQARNNGATPLFIASQNGHAEVVSMLLAKQGVNVNQAMNGGVTPLSASIKKGHTEVAKLLVLHGSMFGVVPIPIGERRNQINLMLGPFARAFRVDYDALCEFRLCLTRVFQNPPSNVDGVPSQAQRQRFAVLRMSQHGSFAVSSIESFLLPCRPDTIAPDLIVRRTLAIIFNLPEERDAASATRQQVGRVQTQLTDFFNKH